MLDYFFWFYKTTNSGIWNIGDIWWKWSFVQHEIKETTEDVKNWRGYVAEKFMKGHMWFG